MHARARWMVLGEYLAGMAAALATALPIHALVSPGTDMVVAMLIGSAVGMTVHLVLSLPLGPLIGMFQFMTTGSLIGMYGGMSFAMRDSMQSVSWAQVAGVAILVGVAVVASVRLYDRAIRGSRASAPERPIAPSRALRRRWDRVSTAYDLATRAEEWRYGDPKRRLFEAMRGRCLMLATGTGHDIHFFPRDLHIVAVDISRRMLEQARSPAAAYGEQVALAQMDASALAFPDATFDTIVTVCTFCSVPDPVIGLRELHRVLKPDGRLLAFEHVRSRLGPLSVMQDIMTPITRRLGPDLNRDTIGHLARSGFLILREENVYLDIVKAVEAFRS